MLGVSRPRPSPALFLHERRVPRPLSALESKSRNSIAAKERSPVRSVGVRAASTERPRPPSPSPLPPPPPTLATSAALFLVGAVLGPPLDGIHGAFGLLRYDVAPLSFGDETGALRTSSLVPLLLGAFYAVSGALHLAGDRALFESEQREKATPAPSFSLALCALAAVVAHLSLSAILYGSPSSLSAPRISLVLFPAAFLVWLFFDRTRTGLALATLTAVAAPLSEIFLMNAAGVWHYPRADLFLFGGERGIVSWVPACYFAYSCWIGALARALAAGDEGARR